MVEGSNNHPLFVFVVDILESRELTWASCEVGSKAFRWSICIQALQVMTMNNVTGHDLRWQIAVGSKCSVRGDRTSRVAMIRLAEYQPQPLP